MRRRFLADGDGLGLGWGEEVEQGTDCGEVSGWTEGRLS
jgi:hypothetical protein